MSSPKKLLVLKIGLKSSSLETCFLTLWSAFCQWNVLSDPLRHPFSKMKLMWDLMTWDMFVVLSLAGSYCAHWFPCVACHFSCDYPCSHWQKQSLPHGLLNGWNSLSVPPQIRRHSFSTAFSCLSSRQRCMLCENAVCKEVSAASSGLHNSLPPIFPLAKVHCWLTSSDFFPRPD